MKERHVEIASGPRSTSLGRPTARSDSEHGGLFADRTRDGRRKGVRT